MPGAARPLQAAAVFSKYRALTMIFFRTTADVGLTRQGMQQRLRAAPADGPNYLTSMYDFFDIARSVGVEAARAVARFGPTSLRNPT